MKRILIGGSPCTHWSIAQKNNRETQPQGEGWELFKNYLIAKEKFKPDFFLYENNKSASQPIKDQISKELGTDLQYINSALVSAQNRQRYYWTNIKNVPQPQDRGILLKDILESGADLSQNEKSYCLTASYNKAVGWNTLERKQRTMVAEPLVPFVQNKLPLLVDKYGYLPDRVYSCDGKSVNIVANGGGQGTKTGLYAVPVNKKAPVYPIYEVRNGLIAIKDKCYDIKLSDGFYIIRKLTVTECCRLQTLPDDYCRAVSATQAYKGLGNGWTAEVIIHILKYMNIPLDEEIEILSMYDGIGTGRYCFDKMGYKNIKYYAYEIDKYPIQVAMSNYDDIMQCGDAFQVRDENWKGV